jgi:integrase
MKKRRTIMAKAKKLPSGAWRTLVYSHTEKVDGKDKRIYESFTSDIKEESELLAAEFRVTRKKKKKTVVSMTVGETIDKYIEMKELLSPTTIESYKKIRQHAFKDIMGLPVKSLDNDVMQKAINDECKRKAEGRNGKRILSPKTVINEYGLLNTALKKYHGVVFDITLPKQINKNVELPEPEEVIKLLIGTSIELPCMLAIWLSFSMSEIRGIKTSSVKDGVICIDQVIVNVGNESVVKQTGKAEKRIRKHQVPGYIMNLIEKQETYLDYINNGTDQILIPLTSSQIYKRYKRILAKSNIDITFHNLRHLNASVMLSLGIPDKYAMERGGWKTPHTMKKVYQHTFSKERKIVDIKIDEYFNKLL